ncbi:MAG: PQQ-binding-like beta-propeller repeat protein [Fermentimonas sp.]|nr:PQQ-binding-like beta-propeller repeat protein [Fermentimonas sp.]
MKAFIRISIILLLLNVYLNVLRASTFEPFKFALVTDTHIGNPLNNEDLIRTVEDINTIPEISFVIISGDVTEFGSYEELRIAKDILDNLNVPYYAIPGNHDSNWSESGTNDFLKIFGNETFGFEYNGYKFIGLASGPNMRMSPGQIPRENLTWFFNELEQTSNEIPIIYVNHYPMDEGLNNWFEVMDELRLYNVKLMLCGHGHNNSALNFEGVKATMCRSNLRAGKEFGGYNIISIESDSIYLQERIVSGETNTPWLAYSTSERPQWEDNPPRPDFTINHNHPFVSETWSMQEKSDMGSGMVLQDNVLYYTNTNGEIKAVKTDDGSELWSYQTDGKIYSTPFIYKDLVWCASSDSYLYGININNGKVVFKLANDKAVVSSPVCADDKVILSGGDGYCRAWNVHTGEIVWEYDSINNFVVTRPTVEDGVVFFGSWGNEFYALNVETGSPEWIWNNGNTNRMLSPAQVIPVITNGRIYLASPDRYMTVLNENTGEVVWRYNDPDHRVRESIGISEDGKTVYAKTMDGEIVAFDATVPVKKIKWVSSGENMGYELAPSALVEKDGVIYAPTDKGNIFAYCASDGKFLWKYRISNGLINMILPTEEGELFVSAMDGKLVKLTLLK